jgi:hypothetical protein
MRCVDSGVRPFARVLDRHPDCARVRPHDDGDRTVVRRVAQRVRHEIEQDAFDLGRLERRRQAGLDRRASSAKRRARASASTPRRQAEMTPASSALRSSSVSTPLSMRASSKRSSTSPEIVATCSCSAGR